MMVWGLRHARIAVPRGVCYGRSDYPVTDGFDVEIAHLRAAWPVGVAEIWCSPAGRCVRTAEALAAGLPVRTDARLQELDFGEWEGRTWESFHDATSDHWAEDPWNRRPPGGESGAELAARVATCREEVLSDATGDVLIVTHAGVLRVWQGLVQGHTGPAVMQLPAPHGEFLSLG
jgi:alpha-ribazole phosphatase